MEKIFYLAQIFDGLNLISGIVLVVSGIVFLIFFIMILTNCCFDNEECLSIKKGIKISIIIFIISSILSIFIPSKKTYLLMMGGKAVDELISDTDLEEIPANTINLLNEYIKAETDKIKSED